jgi:hypothetical protein
MMQLQQAKDGTPVIVTGVPFEPLRRCTGAHPEAPHAVSRSSGDKGTL